MKSVSPSPCPRLSQISVLLFSFPTEPRVRAARGTHRQQAEGEDCGSALRKMESRENTTCDH